MAMSSSAAMAAAPTGAYAPFQYCPYTNPAVGSCLKSVTTGGSFKLGSSTVPITASTPVTFQGGFNVNDDFTTTFFPAVGADTLSKTKLKVPGGLVGLVDTGGFSGLLISLFNAAVASVNDVYATAELVGPAKFDYFNYFFLSGPAVTLPIRVHLENPFLGSNCYIGSSSTPITLNLTDGTTSPPAGTAPITGYAGDASTTPDGGVATATNVKLVDNTFPVPAATGCGYLILDQLVITAAVNLKEGLPSAAGNNVAIMQGTTQIASRQGVQDSVQ
jgi:hypothetical protein